uniref:(California timema) hypothetical protein n=1 Tax=Timema californicum TaxID=61474 RepID=A0A7R9P8M1_TIMCA|nr:unnamed protein product [Timema californicum]
MVTDCKALLCNRLRFIYFSYLLAPLGSTQLKSPHRPCQTLLCRGIGLSSLTGVGFLSGVVTVIFRNSRNGNTIKTLYEAYVAYSNMLCTFWSLHFVHCPFNPYSHIAVRTLKAKMDTYESILLVKSEVLVFKIPPRTTNRGYRAADWNLAEPQWTGRLRLVAKGKECVLKLEDKTTGELFAKCPIETYPGVAVESVTDSSRYFVLRIQDDDGKSESEKINTTWFVLISTRKF